MDNQQFTYSLHSTSFCLTGFLLPKTLTKISGHLEVASRWGQKCISIMVAAVNNARMAHPHVLSCLCLLAFTSHHTLAPTLKKKIHPSQLHMLSHWGQTHSTNCKVSHFLPFFYNVTEERKEKDRLDFKLKRGRGMVAVENAD